jgi:hypothetical protein
LALPTITKWNVRKKYLAFTNNVQSATNEYEKIITNREQGQSNG